MNSNLFQHAQKQASDLVNKMFHGGFTFQGAGKGAQDSMEMAKRMSKPFFPEVPDAKAVLKDLQTPFAGKSSRFS